MFRRLLMLCAILLLGSACHDKPLPTQPPKKTNIGRAGGAVAGPDLALVVGFPQGALSSPTAITVDALPNVYDPYERVIPGTAHELGPSGISFARPVTLRMAIDPASIPEGVPHEMLRIHELVDGEWVLLPEGYVDLDEGAVYANTEHFSTYALLPLWLNGVDTGDQHACAIGVREVWCWGDNSRGQLGADVGAFSSVPVQAEIDLPYEDVQFTYCTITSQGQTSCQTGIRQLQPVVREVAAGYAHTCARFDEGMYCWGANSVGQIGNGQWGAPVAPTLILTGQITDIDVAYLNTCATTTTGLHCWGSAQGNVLGSQPGLNEMCGSTPCSSSPVRVSLSGGDGVDVIDLGLLTGCALRYAGTRVQCWGDNAFGQMGRGFVSASETPMPIGGSWSAVSAGALYGCALDAAREAWCWGQPYTPALGRGIGAVNNAPERVAGNRAFHAIDANDSNYIYSHTCAIGQSDRRVYCWGSNLDGALGVETAPEACPAVVQAHGGYDCAGEPVLAATSMTFNAVSTGVGFTCGDAYGGRPYCWGDNTYGQLGDGTLVSRPTPGPIALQ